MEEWRGLPQHRRGCSRPDLPSLPKNAAVKATQPVKIVPKEERPKGGKTKNSPPRPPLPVSTHVCEWCGKKFEAIQGARYCSASHRVMAYQKRTKSKSHAQPT